MLEVLNTALASTKSVRIFDDPNDLSGAGIGCQTGARCLLQGASMVQ